MLGSKNCVSSSTDNLLEADGVSSNAVASNNSLSLCCSNVVSSDDISAIVLPSTSSLLDNSCNNSSLQLLKVSHDNSSLFVTVAISVMIILMILWVVFAILSALLNLGIIDGNAIRGFLVASSFVLPVLTVAATFVLLFSSVKREMLIEDLRKNYPSRVRRDIDLRDSIISHLSRENDLSSSILGSLFEENSNIKKENDKIREENRRLHFLINTKKSVTRVRSDGTCSD